MISSFLFVFLIAGILYNLLQHLRNSVHMIFKSSFNLKIHGFIVSFYALLNVCNLLLALFIRCIHLSSKCLHLIHHAWLILLACDFKSLLNVLDKSLPFFWGSRVRTNSSSENQESREIFFVHPILFTHQSFSLNNHFCLEHERKSD